MFIVAIFIREVKFMTQLLPACGCWLEEKGQRGGLKLEE